MLRIPAMTAHTIDRFRCPEKTRAITEPRGKRVGMRHGENGVVGLACRPGV
jgi:hypothetical protein